MLAAVSDFSLKSQPPACFSLVSTLSLSHSIAFVPFFFFFFSPFSFSFHTISIHGTTFPLPYTRPCLHALVSSTHPSKVIFFRLFTFPLFSMFPLISKRTRIFVCCSSWDWDCFAKRPKYGRVLEFTINWQTTTNVIHFGCDEIAYNVLHKHT